MPLYSEVGLVFLPKNSTPPIHVPLKSVSIRASVVHAVAQVEITQIYKNEESCPIEAIYYFPIDSNGAVTHFQAELEGKLIKGVVKEKMTAEMIYEEAVQYRRTAILGGETKPDIFKLKVGFLHPEAVVKVVLGYVTEVKNDPDTSALRFFIPTTVAPRYSPPSTGTTSGDFSQMTFSTRSPAPLEIRATINLQGDIESVDCLSKHGIVVERRGPVPEHPGWSNVVVALAGKVTDMDRDFVLLITPYDPVSTPRLYCEQRVELDKGGERKSTAMMLHFIPSFALKEEKVEVILLLDRSGSMDGDKIGMARQALHLVIHSLPPDCYFNIVGFGSDFSPLFPKSSARYGAKTLREAEDYVRRVEANMRGTEILAPLHYIFKQKSIPGYRRQVFVLTDGDVSNTEEVIALVKQYGGRDRVFALGIGSSCSHHLVEGIARAGNGSAAFVGSDEGIPKATLSQLKNSLQTSMHEIQVEWLGIDKGKRKSERVKLNKEKTLFGYNRPIPATTSASSTTTSSNVLQAPQIVPPIFDGSQFVLLGIFKGCAPNGVKITANSPDGPLSLEVLTEEKYALKTTSLLHSLAAVRHIRELEAQDGFREKRLEEAIVKFAVEHGIASKYTSFIAVDDATQQVLEPDEPIITKQRIVPSQLRCKRKGLTPCTNAATSRARSLKIPLKNAPITLKNNVEEEDEDLEEEGLAVRIATTNGLPKVLEIIGLQCFDGSFEWSENICTVLDLDGTTMVRELKSKGWNSKGWATTLAIAVLSTKFQDFQDFWELSVNKGRKWIENNVADGEEMMARSIEMLLVRDME